MAAPAWGSWRAPSTRSVVCVGLCMQNCVGMLVLSYSRLRDAPMYLSGVLVLCCELLKLVFNLIGLLTQSEESASIVAQLHTLLVRDARHLWRYAVPALLYTLQNNIVFVGVSNLSAATFQVTNQLRIPITALCMRFILNQRLTRRQYLAIAVLVAGVILVQANPEKLNDRGGRYRFNSHPRRPLLGLMAVLVQCTCSAFAGVWFEKILKKPPYPGATLPSIWISNIILGICSLPLSLMVVFGAERRQLARAGLWQGWDTVTVLVLFNQAIGGIIVALTFKYADNMLKTFVTAVSLIIGCFGAFYFFDASLAPQFLWGVALVLLATYMYSTTPLSSLPLPQPIRRLLQQADTLTAISSAISSAISRVVEDRGSRNVVGESIDGESMAGEKKRLVSVESAVVAPASDVSDLSEILGDEVNHEVDHEVDHEEEGKSDVEASRDVGREKQSLISPAVSR